MAEGAAFPGEGWLQGDAPLSHVVLSSRARFARNLTAQPFAPHATAESLHRINELVSLALRKQKELAPYQELELDELDTAHRTILEEGRLISKEMARGGPGRSVFLSPDHKASIMVNEEDHLRIQCLEPGMQLDKTIGRLQSIEKSVSEVLAFAWSDRFGFLTACPTNLGTGLRASVMLHLPGLAITREAEDLLGGLGPRGFAVRGFHGENSEFLGDFFQLSNEITLGRSVTEIVKSLQQIIATIMDKEEEARARLSRDRAEVLEDAIWRSYGLLLFARRLPAKEAMTHLSRLRLGIDRGWFPSLAHEELNQLFIRIQPGHLPRDTEGDAKDAEDRDVARARYLRRRLAGIAQAN